MAHMIEYSHHKIVALPWQGMNSGHVGSFVQISRVGHWFGLGATRLKGEKVSQFLFASETGWHRTAGARFTTYCAVSLNVRFDSVIPPAFPHTPAFSF